jgi:hypothetical protein
MQYDIYTTFSYYKRLLFVRFLFPALYSPNSNTLVKGKKVKGK